MATYLPAIAVVFVDSRGFPVPIPDTAVHVYNVTTAAFDTDLTTDEYGILAEGTVTGSAGDEIELSMDDYPLTARWFGAATQAAAYGNPKNTNSVYVADNQFTEEADPTSTDVYYLDPNDAGKGPQFLGEAQIGVLTRFPYQTQISKTLQIFPVGKSDEFLQTEQAFDGSGYLIDIPPLNSSFGPVFDHVDTVTTTGTTNEDLYSDIIPANRFSAPTGDEVRVTYRLFYAANGNDKQAIVYVDSNDIFDSGLLSKNGGAALLEVQMIRSDTDELKIHAIYHDGTNTLLQKNEITGVDFAADIPVVLNCTTPDLAGDVTANSCKAIFYPAAPPELDYLGFLADTLVFNGNTLGFNP